MSFKPAALLLLGLLVVGCAAPGQKVEEADVGNRTDTAELTGNLTRYTEGSVTFVGYGPGKSHNGTFQNWTVTVAKDEGTVTSGRVVIDMASMKTGISALTSHLKGPDFFHVDQYPTATFTASVENGSANGSLTMHGETRNIRFPINASSHGLASDFTLDLSRFGVESRAARDVARIRFNVSS